MGGYGSTRWAWHTKKTAVESCQRLTVKALGAIGKTAKAVRLIYTFTPWGGDPEKLDYPVRLTSTSTPWGARRYWFSCPRCNRRAAILYRPPGGRYYGCRRCYDLTYRSCQTSHEFDNLYNSLALSMQDTHPGVTGRDVKASLEGKRPRRMTLYQARQLAEFQELIANLPDPYAHYLTPGDLCNQSGLTPDSLAALESARLLVPDHGGKYRPKLAGWGKKLAHLLGEGWTLVELQAWARGRWSTPTPRAWPPDRAEWSAKNG